MTKSEFAKAVVGGGMFNAILMGAIGPAHGWAPIIAGCALVAICLAPDVRWRSVTPNQTDGAA